MSVILVEDPTAALTALVGNVPGLEVSQGRTSDGSDWIAVTWPAYEFVMQRDDTGTWSVFDPHFGGAVISTGPTAPEAFKAALERS